MMLFLWYQMVLGGGTPTHWQTSRRELPTPTDIVPPSDATPATTEIRGERAIIDASLILRKSMLLKMEVN